MLCYVLNGYTPNGRSFFTPYPGRAMFVALVVLLLSSPAPSVGDQLFCADANGKYNPNSTYRSSLRSLADELTARATKSHSATGTAGAGSGKVYGAVLCRGDSTGADCSGRLREAFGRIFPSEATQTKTSRLVGTYGYMAPEYAFEGLLSIKSDVFSFGVLLLEIISGKRSAGFQHYGEGEFHNLLQYAWQMWEEERWHEFTDQSIGDKYESGDMMKYLRLALMCVQVKAVDRPTMSDIVAMLSSDDITVPEPRQPAYSYTRVDVSVNINLSCTRNDITLTTTDGR